MSAGPGAWAGRGAAVGLSGPCRGAARGLPWARLRPPSSLRAVSVAAAPSLSPPPDPRTRRFPPPPPPLWAPRPACVGGTGGLRASGGDPRKAGPGGGGLAGGGGCAASGELLPHRPGVGKRLDPEAAVSEAGGCD